MPHIAKEERWNNDEILEINIMLYFELMFLINFDRIFIKVPGFLVLLTNSLPNKELVKSLEDIIYFDSKARNLYQTTEGG